MNLGRFKIIGLMGLVIVSALEFWGIRALNDLSFQFYVNGSPLLSQMIGALVLGAIPMGNILAFGLLFFLRRRGKLPFLLGFETFGAIVLTLYISGFVLFPDLSVKPLHNHFLKTLVPYFQTGPLISSVGMVSLFSVMIAILTLPQVAFALLGGWLFRWVHRHGSRSQTGS